MICERTARTVAVIHVPAVVDENDRNKGWLYTALRFAVTDQADSFLVNYLTTIRRSA